MSQTGMSAASPALLSTKLFMPLPRTEQVCRPRLRQLLNQGLESRLILVSAPAGFGKTTLLGEWVSSLPGARKEGAPQAAPPGSCPPDPLSVRPPLSVAWLSLDAADNDPARFLRYLVAALQAAVPGVGQAALDMLPASPSPLAETLLTILLNDVMALSTPMLLVLDDYHLIDNRAIHEAVTYLLDHSPANAHVVLSTRADPPLPLARWRSRGQMREVRADDLRFTPEEAALFLNERMELNLAAPEIAALEERTEGWITGLQVAALSLRGRPDAAAFIRSFSGSHRYVLDYLIEEVLEHQPEEVLTFLLQTSILERLCGPLCDAVTGQSTGQALLEYLERRNLFLIPLDDERIWYRYHHLFADLLRTQLLKSLGAPGMAGLHVRASEWYAQNGSILEAIHHASEAADEERVERLIEQNYAEILSRGEQSAMRFWAGKLSRELVYRRPWLCIYEAHSHAWFGELDQADLLLEKAEERIQSAAPASDLHSMLAHLAYVRSRVAAMRGDIRRAIDICLAARDHVPAGNLSLQFNTRVTLGYEYFLIGDYASARQILSEAVQAGIATGALIFTVASYCFIARMAAVQGLLHESYDTYQAAAQLIAESRAEHRDATALVEVGMADVLCEWNHIDAALAHIKQGLAWLPYWGKADDWALAYVTLARIHLAQANMGEAAAAVEKAAQHVQASGVFSEARQAVEVAQVRLWLAQGDLQAAARWAASREARSTAGGRSGFEDELAGIAQARAYIALRRPGEAIGLLAQLEEAARPAGRVGRVVEILLLRALAMQELGDFERAMVALTECLALAEPEGYTRIFLDAGAPLQELLRGGQRRRRWAMPSLAAHVQQLCAISLSPTPASDLQQPSPSPRRPASGLVEPLSERELQVLRLLVAGRSNQEIAADLVLATGTVKTHIHNIYGKLGVATRVQAIARARELGLL